MSGNFSSPHYSREVVTKLPRRLLDGGAKVGRLLEQYVDRLSSEPARRQACRRGVSTGVVDVFVNHAG